ncbi:hypothetical protein N7468_009513 [Penicillium chermesinum]|uniref:Nucleoside phosphorylase domain-containing protein n=1 Tax=Penicillium chermesinum TaxID=63820 RepID=A0A9W9TFB7_9EURO|nr:uncharacterized protein N7468_009513 [Penicillium chermesinum]KAJ5220309.1 hypothetical protein N7468_009513 [Penicillium chermesinum]KAJ6157752.1 hypothetical protein N7470_005344 [Penicillium chermesinum]
MASSSPLDLCTVVWLCPLEIELRAALAMLDTISDEIPPRVRGQNVIYMIGKVGAHMVAVVGYYQEQGLAASGSMAAEVMRDLPNLQFGLLVGIAGGIPRPNDNMQLGDVAVAVPEGNRPGVVGYDLGKAGENGSFELKHWQNSTHPFLRSVINLIKARGDSRFRRHLPTHGLEFQRPKSDVSDPNQIHPKVHYGTILSGNTVVKSKEKRDQLSLQYGGIAVEMEAAGIMTRLPAAVIRGISDFADAAKSNEWQPYAAITAAAFAKELLLNLPVEAPHERKDPPLASFAVKKSSSPFSNQDIRLAQNLPEQWAFAGREAEMALLKSELGFQERAPLQKIVVGLWGLTGIGKSQLAARFVKNQREMHPSREVFWINGESRESLEKSVIGMLKSGDGSINEIGELRKDSRTSRGDLINLFFTELNHLEDSRWLLIIDGVNEEQYPATKDLPPYDIRDSINGLLRGYVLITSRRRDIVERYHPIEEVKGLLNTDAVGLIKSKVHSQYLQGVEALVNLLKGLPLAIRLAISVISRDRCTCSDYLDRWTSRDEAREVLGTNDTLYRSLDLSFEELEHADPIAAKILTLFSFLHHHDLWYELLHNASEDIYPSWIQGIAARKVSFQRLSGLLADLSFIERKIHSNDNRRWEIHPIIQAVARQRAQANEGEYMVVAISLVASAVPRSHEESAWGNMRRLAPHVEVCWKYIERGRWGPQTDLTDLESLARVFRHIGRYNEACLMYRMIEHGLQQHNLSFDNKEFLADTLTNLGLVYTRQWRFDLALNTFNRSLELMRELGILTPDALMSVQYNKAVVFVFKNELDEAEILLRRAASHFAARSTDPSSLLQIGRDSIYLRIMNDLGEVLLQKGDVKSAFEIFNHIHKQQHFHQMEANQTILSIELNIGRAYSRAGKYAEARDILMNIIEVYTEFWGRHHPETMRAIHELAWTLMEKGKTKQDCGEEGFHEFNAAEELWNEALGFYKESHGPQSDLVVRMRANLEHLHVLKNPGWDFIGI